MTNFIFKSSRRLIKNSPTNDAILGQLKIVQSQNRYLRQDLVDLKLMINKLLIDKHLQMQVDQYFDKEQNEIPPLSEQERDLD